MCDSKELKAVFTCDEINNEIEDSTTVNLYDESNQHRLQISFSDIEIPKYTAQSIQHDKVKGIGDVRSRNQNRSPENTDWLLVTPFIVLEYKK